MYGCSEPIIIYGWVENNTNFMLDPEWIVTNYKIINVYASEVVRNHLYSACYGIECKLLTNGSIIINEDKKEEVKKLYDLWYNYQKKQKNKKICELGYHLAISGDYEWEHKYYNL
jgi:hypothetical protein